MKWKTIFPDPDVVGQSEYRAIYDTVSDGIDGRTTMNSDDQELVCDMLAEFEDWGKSLREKMQHVQTNDK